MLLLSSSPKNKTTMTKQELINRVADRSGYNRQQVSDIIEASMQVTTESFIQGHNITLRGFGVFKVLTRKARPARDFKNEEVLRLPPRRVIKFVAYNDLKNALNGE